jgi:hypothetical protein
MKIRFLIIISVLFIQASTYSQTYNEQQFTSLTNRELVKLYESQVKELNAMMKTESEISNSKDAIKLKMKTIENLYEFASFVDSFVKKVSKYKIIYDECRIKFSTYIYDSYYPLFKREESDFNANLKSDILAAKNNLQKLNEIKTEICWDKTQYQDIADEIERFNQIIRIYEEFQSLIVSTNDSIKINVKTFSLTKFSLLTDKMNLWQIKSNQSITKMQSQISELKCQYHELLFETLNSEWTQIEKQTFTIEDVDYFNSLMGEFISLSDKIEKENCVGQEKFKTLHDKAALKQKTVNVYLEKEIRKQKLAEEKEQAEYLKNNPVSFYEAALFYDVIGTPNLRVSLCNNTNTTVDAFKARVSCYNRFDEPVNNIFYNSNKGAIINQPNPPIRPDECGGWLTAYALYFQEETAKVKVVLTEIHFTNGKTWRPNKGHTISIIAEFLY